MILTRSKARPRRSPEDRERNTYGLPTGEPIRKALVTTFRAQRVQMLAALGVRREKWARWILTKDAGAWDPNSFEFPAFELGALAMSERMTPLITALWDKAGQQFTSKVGLDPDRWEVTNPHTERMIREASLEFCKATNETTSLNLAEALERTRQELVEGIVQRGESLERLTKRVQTIFDQAETWRARRIAATESSRAVHSAQEEAAKQSNVVAGWEWLLSDDACPLCHTVARRAKQVRLGQPFAIVGDHPVYSEIRFPPLHPSCQCTVIEVLKPEYGGPENPQWAETLKQPKPTEEDGARPHGKPAASVAGRSYNQDVMKVYRTLGGPKPPRRRGKP